MPWERKIDLAPDTVHRARSSLISGASVMRRLRGIIRGSEAWLVLLGAVSGIASGLVVALIGTTSNALHTLFFGVHNGRVSGVIHLQRGLLTPIIGGLVLGLAGWLWARR